MTKTTKNETSILGAYGHRSFLTISVRCGARLYAVEVTRDICPRVNPTGLHNIDIWGASRLSAARLSALAFAVTEFFSARYAYVDGFEPAHFATPEAAGSLVDLRWSNRAAGIAA